MNRRNFIGALAVAGGCQRKKGAGYRGFAFVANSAGQAVAAVDLQAFAVVRHIRLQGNPRAIVAHPTRPLVYALTPENGQLHRIALATLKAESSRSFTQTATGIRVAPDGSAWVLSSAERKLIRVDLDSLVPESIIGLPDGVENFELSQQRPFAILRLKSGRIAMVDLAQRRVLWERRVGDSSGPAAFLKNGKLVLAASPADQLLRVFNDAGSQVVDLPLAVRPEHFCFKQDGGQLFITGAGMDAVAVVYPFQTQVAGTILAGHSPGAMATSAAPDFLFIANTDAGAVTAIDIRTQKVRAAVPVGRRPESIVVTPDNNFALVLSRESGDMAVIRVDAMAGRRTKAAPLFTIIPVGSEPVAAVVLDV